TDRLYRRVQSAQPEPLLIRCASRRFAKPPVRFERGIGSHPAKPLPTRHDEQTALASYADWRILCTMPPEKVSAPECQVWMGEADGTSRGCSMKLPPLHPQYCSVVGELGARANSRPARIGRGRFEGALRAAPNHRVTLVQCGCALLPEHGS